MILGRSLLRNHEQNARYDAVVTPHLPAGYNLARWLTRSEQDAEDVLQEACLRAFKFCGDFQGDDGRPWFLTIVRNSCYTWLRQNRRHELDASFDPELHDISDESCNPELVLLRGVDVQLVREAMENLPLEFREVVVLREIEGLSYKEIGRVADLPVGTVMSRLARARRRLQNQLAPHGNEVNEGAACRATPPKEAKSDLL